MTGIEVTDEVLARYNKDMTREEGEQAGIKLAKEMIAITEDFADGYYFSKTIKLVRHFLANPHLLDEPVYKPLEM